MPAEPRRPSISDLAELSGHTPGEVIGALWELRQLDPDNEGGWTIGEQLRWEYERELAAGTFDLEP